jgi:hypothetical protein
MIDSSPYQDPIMVSLDYLLYPRSWIIHMLLFQIHPLMHQSIPIECINGKGQGLGENEEVLCNLHNAIKNLP